MLYVMCYGLRLAAEQVKLGATCSGAILDRTAMQEPPHCAGGTAPATFGVALPPLALSHPLPLALASPPLSAPSVLCLASFLSAV